MDFKTKTRIEYEHQFFNFSSDTIIDCYKDLLKSTICENGVHGMVKMLRNKITPAAADPAAVESALEEMADSLRCQYDRGIDYAMTTVESKVRDCFHIPDNLRLPEDQVIATVKGVDKDGLDAEIAALQQEWRNIAVLMEEAKEEQAEVDETIAVLEAADALPFYPLPKDL